ncbi:nucleotidyltransferase family protein [Erwinia sp.]|uniref:nucleotidyltransferase family protein n=1 Tax=Erwinia citreus TaxID=558 RepID=UPI003C7779A7
MKFGIVIAAAGQGKRFVQAGGAGNKLNAALGKTTIFEQTLLQALAAELPVLVVTRPENGLVQQVCTRYQVPYTLLASDGLGESIAAAVNATPDWEGWLIQLADMPYVPPAVFQAVAKELRNHAIVQPRFEQLPGHPVGFNATLRKALCALKGDEGARSLLRHSPVFTLSLSSSAILQDIDLPSQLPSEE